MIYGPDDKSIRFQCAASLKTSDGELLQKDTPGGHGEEAPVRRLLGTPALRRQREPDRWSNRPEDRDGLIKTGRTIQFYRKADDVSKEAAEKL